jgi:hypothetical protein
VPTHHRIEQPDPLISFEEFLAKIIFHRQKGLLGSFNYVEATEGFMHIDKQLLPVNVFSLFVFEEHKTPPVCKPIILNSAGRIALAEEKKSSYGIYRYYLTVEEFESRLQRLQKESLWEMSGKTLITGDFTPLLPQFIPADGTDTVPLNGVLKNNFWNGSYVFELFDTEKKYLKKFSDSLNLLQSLSHEVGKFVPLKLASISDRLGNILIQIQSNIGVFELSSDKNDNNTYSFAWREGTKKRKCQLVSVSEVDKNIIDFQNRRSPRDMSWNLSLGKAPEIDRTYLFDLENKILLAASSPIAFLREINFNIFPICPEPRTICIPQENGSFQTERLAVSSSMDAGGQVGFTDIFGYKKLARERIYKAEREELIKRREFVQYGLVFDKKAEHERAVSDICTLLHRHGRKAVWLWDPYLSAQDIMKTLFFNPYSGSGLRALTSKKACTLGKSVALSGREKRLSVEAWKKHQASFLDTPGNNYRGINLEFKISYDQGIAFHDRFLIFPETDNEPVAWSLGTSINSLGENHHILQKVAHARLIADAFQDIWSKLSENKYLIWKRP